MQTHEYKFLDSKQRAYPLELVGRVVTQRRPETVEEFRSLVENGDESRIVTLATQQLLLNGQRAFKEVAESEEVQKLVREGRVDEAMAVIQKAADEYLDGGRKAGTPSEARKAKATVGKLQAAAAADPKLAAKLAALGIEI